MPANPEILHAVFEGDDEENRAEIDRIGKILGVQPKESGPDGTHYSVTRDFGGVTYRAFSIDHAEMDRYRNQETF